MLQQSGCQQQQQQGMCVACAWAARAGAHPVEPDLHRAIAQAVISKGHVLTLACTAAMLSPLHWLHPSIKDAAALMGVLARLLKSNLVWRLNSCSHGH